MKREQEPISKKTKGFDTVVLLQDLLDFSQLEGEELELQVKLERGI